MRNTVTYCGGKCLTLHLYSDSVRSLNSEVGSHWAAPTVNVSAGINVGSVFAVQVHLTDP